MFQSSRRASKSTPKETIIIRSLGGGRWRRESCKKREKTRTEQKVKSIKVGFSILNNAVFSRCSRRYKDCTYDF